MNRPFSRLFHPLFPVALLLALSSCCTQTPRKDVDSERLWAVLETGTPFEREELCAEYAFGSTLSVDYGKAFVLCRKAVEGCTAMAAFILSHLYTEGLGVKADPETALAWIYFMATDYFADIALRRAVDLELSLTPAQRHSAKMRAREWTKKYCRYRKDDE